MENITLITNADLRLAANQKAWPMQESVERAVTDAFASLGVRVSRGHDYEPHKQHGFIDRGFQMDLQRRHGGFRLLIRRGFN